MKKVKVSDNAVRRLPRYLRKLDELAASGVTRISSADLGRQMGITPSQIRQDLSTFGEFGLQGYGYHVAALRNELAAILGADNGFTAILVGVGKIGQALISNFDFKACGVELKCAFDIRPDLADSNVNDIPVHHMNELENYLENNHIDIAVLAVPKHIAVGTAKMLSDNGIEAIWNFTNKEISELSHMLLIENMHFSDSLLALSYYLSERKQREYICNRYVV